MFLVEEFRKANRQQKQQPQLHSGQAQSQPDPVPAAMWQENEGWTEASQPGVDTVDA